MDKTKLSNLADKAAKNAIRGMRNFENTIEDEVPVNSEEGEELDIEALSEFDIFDFCENEYIKKGDFIEYTIKKNGATAGFKKHPYSWQKLQKEFGEGRYKMLAKSTITGKIVKTQSQSIEDLQDDDSKNNNRNNFGFDPASLVHQIAEAVKPKNDGLGFAEIMSLMNNASDKARSEAQQSNQTVIQMMQQNTMVMMEMFKSQNNSSGNGTLELAKMMQTVAEKLQDSQVRMMEKMEARFERTIEKLNQNDKPNSSLSMMDMLKLKEDAEDRGFKRYNLLNQIAEGKAQERLDLIEEYRENGGAGEKKEKSMTDNLIETMLPAIAGALAPKAPVPPRPTVQPRGKLPTRPNAPQAASTARVQTTHQKSNPNQKTSGPQNRSNVGQVPRTAHQVNSSGLPKAIFPKTEQPVKPVQKVEVVQVVNEAPENAALRGYYTDILMPTFTQLLVKQSEPSDAANEIEGVFQANNIDKKDFLKNVSVSDILEVAKGYDLPHHLVNPWFEEIYAYLETGHGTAQ